MITFTEYCTGDCTERFAETVARSPFDIEKLFDAMELEVHRLDASGRLDELSSGMAGLLGGAKGVGSGLWNGVKNAASGASNYFQNAAAKGSFEQRKSEALKRLGEFQALLFDIGADNPRNSAVLAKWADMIRQYSWEKAAQRIAAMKNDPATQAAQQSSQQNNVAVPPPAGNSNNPLIGNTATPTNANPFGTFTATT